MVPKDDKLDRRGVSPEPLENQPLEWEQEDLDIENRKPDLGESEADTSEL